MGGQSVLEIKIGVVTPCIEGKKMVGPAGLEPATTRL